MGWPGGIGRIAGAILLLLTIETAVAYAQQPKDGFFTTADGVKIYYLTAGGATSHRQTGRAAPKTSSS